MNTSSNLRFEVAKRLRQLRKSKNMSQAAVAAKAQLGESAVSQLENGVRNISLDTIERYCSAIDQDPFEFLSTLSTLRKDSTTYDPQGRVIHDLVRLLSVPEKEALILLMNSLVINRT